MQQIVFAYWYVYIHMYVIFQKEATVLKGVGAMGVAGWQRGGYYIALVFPDDVVFWYIFIWLVDPWSYKKDGI